MGLRMVRLRGGLPALLTLIALLVVGPTLTACGRKGAPAAAPPAPEAERPRVITVNIGAEPRSLDPAKVEDVISMTVVQQLFEGLTQDTPQGPAPAVAEAWEVSPDGLTYTFRLRPARWSNGEPVTAGDFEYAWKRMLDPGTASPYAHILYPLAGAEAYNAADPRKEGAEGMARLRNAVGVRAEDERTLRVTLATPAPHFLHLTSLAEYAPVNRRALEAGGEGWAAKPETLVGNGPFRLADWRPRSELVLERNPSYRAAAVVGLDRIRMAIVSDRATSLTMFENGELDLIMPGLVPAAETPRLSKAGKLRRAPALSTGFVVFNTRKPPLNDPRVRRALSLAVDRRALAEVIAHGLEAPATAFVPPGILNPATGKDFRGEGGDLYPARDLEAARKLLAEAGYPGGKGFPALTFLYPVEGEKRPREAVQQMWQKDLGIRVKLEGLEFPSMLDRLHAGGFDLAALGWGADYPDPLTFLEVYASGNPMNLSGWGEAAYDGLIGRARQTPEPRARMLALHEAEALLMERMPLAPLTFAQQAWVQRNDLQGVEFNPLGMIDFKRVRLGGAR